MSEDSVWKILYDSGKLLSSEFEEYMRSVDDKAHFVKNLPEIMLDANIEFIKSLNEWDDIADFLFFKEDLSENFKIKHLYNDMEGNKTIITFLNRQYSKTQFENEFPDIFKNIYSDNNDVKKTLEYDFDIFNTPIKIQEFINGGRCTTYKMINGLLHNENGPAIECDSVECNMMHGINGPAEITNQYKLYYLYGKKYTKEKYDELVKKIQIEEQNPLTYLIKMPPDEFYKFIQKNKRDISILDWKINQKRDISILEENLIPGEITTEYELIFSDNRKIKICQNKWIIYYKNNIKHNENGAAVTIYNSDGSIGKEWWIDGKLHRIGGPAKILTLGNLQAARYWSSLNTDLTEYFINGIEYSKIEYYKELNRNLENNQLIKPSALFNQLKKKLQEIQLLPLKSIGKKSNSEKAIYRIIATQIKNLTRVIIINYTNSSNQTNTINQFLTSEIGNSIIGYLTGLVIQKIEQKIENDHLNEISKELRIENISTVGNKLIDEIFGSILPLLVGSSKLRIENCLNQIDYGEGEFSNLDKINVKRIERKH